MNDIQKPGHRRYGAAAKQEIANPAFVQKVPLQVLQEHQQRLTDWQAKLEHVNSALNALE